MKISFDDNKKIIRLENINAFDPESVFECGQCFRFNKQQDGSYKGIAAGKEISIAKGKEDIIIYNSTKEDYENIWEKYFDIERDYVSIMKSLAEKDEVMREAIKYGEGIRILRQDPWETIISFIISQNNHIPRIKKCVEGISEKCGTPLENGGFAFPTYEQLARADDKILEPIKLGYRTSYILETSKEVACDGGKRFEESKDLETKELKEYLLSLKGIGPKVANCILLFGYGRMDSFPIDVWIKRVMNQLYGIPEKELKTMERFAAETFGEYGGIAQQYLFYYMKNRKV